MFINGKNIPLKINSGKWCEGHVQGIAVDTKKEYIYYSFTTMLLKTDLEGNIIGTVEGLIGHLGCIDFNDGDGKLYGSLELKHDSIGKGIMARTGIDIAEEDAFYIAIFDVDKIDRMHMDAEADGVVKAVYLPDVVEDYNGSEADGHPHHLGCSGIDGMGVGPVFGENANSAHMLMVAYGIYKDNARCDNDYQVILQFDQRRFDDYAQPLIQGQPHHSGVRCDAKYFVYTGNTDWGIQNLEYDAFTGDWYAAVYEGKKETFPNFPMFVIDGHKMPEMRELRGRDGESGLCLSLKEEGYFDDANNIYGLGFEYGQTGMYAFGDGYFYFSQNGSEKIDGKKYQYTDVCLYKRVVGNEYGFKLVKKKLFGADSDGTAASKLAMKEAKKKKKDKTVIVPIVVNDKDEKEEKEEEAEKEEKEFVFVPLDNNDENKSEEKEEVKEGSAENAAEEKAEEENEEKSEDEKKIDINMGYVSDGDDDGEKEEEKDEETPEDEEEESENENEDEEKLEVLIEDNAQEAQEEEEKTEETPVVLSAEEEPEEEPAPESLPYGYDIYEIRVNNPAIAERVFADNDISYTPVMNGYQVVLEKSAMPMLLEMLCLSGASLTAAIPLA